jgi:hypothetical protein
MPATKSAAGQRPRRVVRAGKPATQPPAPKGSYIYRDPFYLELEPLLSEAVRFLDSDFDRSDLTPYHLVAVLFELSATKTALKQADPNCAGKRQEVSRQFRKIAAEIMAGYRNEMKKR